MTDERSKRIFLSPPSAGSAEIEAVSKALRSGWVAPLGPEVDAFEREVADFVGVDFAIALSSGTAGLHLGLLALGVKPGDEVVVPTLTFAATAFAVNYVGAKPVFLDVEAESWNLDPQLLSDFLETRSSESRLPAAVISVDVFGRPCNYDQLSPLAVAYGVPMLEDAAEALGARVGTRSAGSFGQAGVLSFNGNKIITTSGGGMLVTDNSELASRVRHLATQAREPVPWYEHRDIGYNYRLSNLLAAVGRVQLARLPDFVDRRRAIRQEYTAELAEAPGVRVMGNPPWGVGNDWLTTAVFDPEIHPNAPSRIRRRLDAENVESRPLWKPMHLQPVFTGSESVLNGTADALYEAGLCLPSGSDLTHEQVSWISSLVRESLAAA